MNAVRSGTVIMARLATRSSWGHRSKITKSYDDSDNEFAFANNKYIYPTKTKK
jgi:hypothetical protein